MSFGGNQFNPDSPGVTELLGHFHTSEIWIPANIANSFAVVTNAAANTYGNYTQLLAASALDLGLDRFIIVGLPPADGSYELEFATGNAGFEVPFTQTRTYIDATGVNLPRNPIEIYSTAIAVGTRLSVRAKCSIAGPQTLLIQVGYHVEI